MIAVMVLWGLSFAGLGWLVFKIADGADPPPDADPATKFKRKLT